MKINELKMVKGMFKNTYTSNWLDTLSVSEMTGDIINIKLNGKEYAVKFKINKEDDYADVFCKGKYLGTLFYDGRSYDFDESNYFDKCWGLTVENTYEDPSDEEDNKKMKKEWDKDYGGYEDNDGNYDKMDD